MPQPTQAQRLEDVESTLQSINEQIKELIQSNHAMNEKFTAMMGKIEKVEESQAHTSTEQEKIREEFKASQQHGDSEDRSENHAVQNWKDGEVRPPWEKGDRMGNPLYRAGNHRNMGFQHPFASGSNTGDQSNWRFRRLEFPVFTGENPDGWILRAERYFSLY